MNSNRHGVPTRSSTRTIALIAAVCALIGAVVIAVRATGDSASASETTATQGQHSSGHSVDSGTTAQNAADANGSDPLTVTEVDRTFLVKVRQAGLWEIPAGRLAQTNTSNEVVKRAGQHLLDGHSKLDQLVREDARILGVELPNEATEEQQGFVRQLEAAKDAEFDKLFANILRSTHGKIFATIAEVRASTQNDLIRRHARQANQTVMDHMEVLEDTGLVEASTLQEIEKAVAPK